MTKGDVVNTISNIAAGAALVYQPAVGVEVVVKNALTSSGAADMVVELYDGTLISMFGPDSQGWAGSLFVNNTNYLRLYNGNAATKTLGATGVQVK